MVMSLRGLPSESNWKHARARISQSCPNRALFDFRGSSSVSIGSTIHPRKLVCFFLEIMLLFTHNHQVLAQESLAAEQHM